MSDGPALRLKGAVMFNFPVNELCVDVKKYTWNINNANKIQIEYK